jgi:hypothetical protein
MGKRTLLNYDISILTGDRCHVKQIFNHINYSESYFYFRVFKQSNMCVITRVCESDSFIFLNCLIVAYLPLLSHFVISLSFLFTFFFTGATTLWESWPPPWFRNSTFFRGGVVSLMSNLQTGGQVLHFVWPLPFYLSGMNGSTRSLRSRQHSSPSHWGAQTSSPRQGYSPRGGLIYITLEYYNKRLRFRCLSTLFKGPVQQ